MMLPSTILPNGYAPYSRNMDHIDPDDAAAFCRVYGQLQLLYPRESTPSWMMHAWAYLACRALDSVQEPPSDQADFDALQAEGHRRRKALRDARRKPDAS